MYALKITEPLIGSLRSMSTLASSNITPTPIPSLGHQLFSTHALAPSCYPGDHDCRGEKKRGNTHSAAPGAGRVESICDPSRIASFSAL